MTAGKPLAALLERAAPGTVSTRASDRLAYAHDASHYLLTPDVVVKPRDTAEVAALLGAAREAGASLTFRAGGTSLSGQSTTAGILADTRRHFQHVDVLDDGERVCAQPGAVVRSVNARLARHARRLGPDPASESACTVGGVVANNSSGMACGVAYNAYRTLESAVLVLASGTVLDTGAPDADARLRASEPQLYEGLARLRDRVRGNVDSRERIARLFSVKNTMGYGINSFIDHSAPVKILERLVIGSEGTLAFVAEARFRTIAAHQNAATALLLFADLSAATASLPALVATDPATVELMDEASLKVAQRDRLAEPDLRALTVRGHAALLVEYRDATPEALAERADRAGQTLADLPLAGRAKLSTEPARRARLWQLRKGLYAAVASARPSGTTALLEDIAVPVDRLLPAGEALTRLFAQHGYSDSVIFGHARDGNVHFMLNERFDRTASVDRYLAFTEDLVELVLGLGGTLKAEHGTGRIMAPFVRRQYGDELYDVMWQVKQLADPSGLLNAGVLLSEDDRAHVRHLKTVLPVEEEVDRCVECGYCEPVCPSRNLTTTPRQRIVLRREIARAAAAGDQALKAELESAYDYDGIDTCAADGMCETACPVSIDTGALVKRLRTERGGRLRNTLAAAAARRWDGATRLAGWALSTADTLPAPLVLGATHAARAAAGAEAIPAWSKDLPRGGARRTAQGATAPQAVYFPACISTVFGPASPGCGAAPALLALCERAGVDLRIPEGIAGLCCGTPWRSKGLPRGHRRMRDQVRPVLARASGDGGLPVITDASSCAEGLRTLLADPESADLTVMDAVDFVADVVLDRLTVGRRLPSLALHPTCSSARAGSDGAVLRIGAAIADEVVVPDEWGCCGFAGDRGLLHPELTAAATRPEADSVTSREFAAYASTNRTCELAMTRATGRTYRHLLEFLEEVTRPGR